MRACKMLKQSSFPTSTPTTTPRESTPPSDTELQPNLKLSSPPSTNQQTVQKSIASHTALRAFGLCCVVTLTFGSRRSPSLGNIPRVCSADGSKRPTIFPIRVCAKTGFVNRSKTPRSAESSLRPVVDEACLVRGSVARSVCRLAGKVDLIGFLKTLRSTRGPFSPT